MHSRNYSQRSLNVQTQFGFSKKDVFKIWVAHEIQVKIWNRIKVISNTILVWKILCLNIHFVKVLITISYVYIDVKKNVDLNILDKFMFLYYK